MTTPAPEKEVAPRSAWTVLSLLEWSDRYLRERAFRESRLNAELLLSHALGLPRLGLYLQFDRPLTPEEIAAFKGLLLRRMTHEPVQYILGETEFMGLPFEVGPAVLIPRPETEELVEEVLSWLNASHREEGEILEIGAGSGNIAVALGKSLPDLRVTSLEKSPDALDVARRNRDRHGVKNVEFLQGDVFDAPLGGRKFDAVVSNPPYIAEGEIDTLDPEVKDFEPRMATAGGSDGLVFVRKIAALASVLLRPGGGMFLEIADGQAGAAAAIARDSGFEGVVVKKDFAGIGRILSGFSPQGRPPA